MENLPTFITLVFILTTALSVYLIYRAAHQSKWTLILLLMWLSAQGLIASGGFYTITNTIPPRFLLLIGPALVAILFLFVLKSGKVFLDQLDLKTLTLFHTVRIPVELCLYWLSVHKTVPQLMTFDGWNFDVLSGLSSPFIYFLVLKNKVGKKVLITWNIICLALLFNIVSLAVLSAPFPFQQLAFNQPNVAVLHFPYIWLPCCIVPLVLLAHLASLRQLILNK